MTPALLPPCLIAACAGPVDNDPTTDNDPEAQSVVVDLQAYCGADF